MKTFPVLEMDKTSLFFGKNFKKKMWAKNFFFKKTKSILCTNIKKEKKKKKRLITFLFLNQFGRKFKMFFSNR